MDFFSSFPSKSVLCLSTRWLIGTLPLTEIAQWMYMLDLRQVKHTVTTGFETMIVSFQRHYLNNFKC